MLSMRLVAGIAFIVITSIATTLLGCAHGRGSRSLAVEGDADSIIFGYLIRRCEVERGNWSFNLQHGPFTCKEGTPSAGSSVNGAAVEHGRREYDCQAGTIPNAEWLFAGRVFRCEVDNLVLLQPDGGAGAENIGLPMGM